ncbi:MAG: BTAD domain-containing putative transcriptional regulator [Actinocatenispora sp.]
MAACRQIFGVLGPLQVPSGDAAPPIAGTKRRILLASLLLRPNEIVTLSDLTDALWPAERPRSARANIQTYVSTLRRCLPTGPDGPRLTTRGDGYRIEVARDELDATVFEDLLAAARREQAHGGAARALRVLDDALRLWRGDVLADLPDCHAWRSAVHQLAELRLGAIEQRAQARIDTGQYPAAISELRALIDTHPFREGLWEHLLIALHATGRRADALRAYAEVRDLLVGELGVEPGARLRDIHRGILDGALEPATPSGAPSGPPVTVPGPTGATTATPTPTTAPDVPRPDADGGVPYVVVHPRQLPADIPDFVGRSNHLSRLDELLAPGEPGQPPSVGIVVGPPGTGKSTLAVRAAHRASARYPDGQIHVDLAGSTAPRAVTHVYREVLRALGVPAPAVPHRAAERAALYRSVLARRRILLVLDDAADAQQLRDLLPPNGGCAVLATSRRHLATVPGAHAIHLDTFASGEARALLARIVGAERVDREPDEAAAICRACGYLPLAIRIAGAKLAARRAWSLRILADRLADGSRRLGELHAETGRLRASFELSVRQLPPDAAAAFRMLGLFSTTPVPGWMIGALLGRDSADDVLDTLVDANLLQLVGPDASGQPRYRLHDLLHCYAAEAAAREPADLRREVLARVGAGWLGLAERAVALLPACIFRPTAGSTVRWCPDPTGAARTVRQPVAWFDAERQVLMETIELAAQAGLDELAWELAAALVPYFDQRSNYPDWTRCHEAALDAVRRAGNLHGEAALLRGLGQVRIYHDSYAEAAILMRRSRMLSRRIGDRRGIAIATVGLASVYRVVRDFDRAMRCYRTGLAEVVRLGDLNCEAQVRNAMGIICRERGEYRSATVWFRTARQLARRIGDPHREASVLCQIGLLHLEKSLPRQALGSLHEAIATFQNLGDEHCAGYALEAVGRAQLLLGETVRAQHALTEALSIFRATGDRRGQATVTELLGELHRSRHDARAASSCSVHATRLWQQIGARPVAPLTAT